LNKNTISKGLPEHCSTGGGVALHEEAPEGGTQVISISNSHVSLLVGAAGEPVTPADESGIEGVVGNSVDSGTCSRVGAGAVGSKG
jgi:hypothetical protein